MNEAGGAAGATRRPSFFVRMRFGEGEEARAPPWPRAHTRTRSRRSGAEEEELDGKRLFTDGLFVEATRQQVAATKFPTFQNGLNALKVSL